MIFSNIFFSALGGDNLPEISIENISQNKASMMLMNLFYSGNIQRYLSQHHKDFFLPCHIVFLKENRYETINKFVISNGKTVLVPEIDFQRIACFSSSYGFLSVPGAREAKMSLFDLLQSSNESLDYHGINETMHFFSYPCNSFGPFSVGSRFSLRRFPELPSCEKQQDISIEQSFQNCLRNFLSIGFPDPGNLICEAPESKNIVESVDFCDVHGFITMKVMKMFYFHETTLMKGYVPVTCWCVRNRVLQEHPSFIPNAFFVENAHYLNYYIPVALPDKQPLFNLDRIKNAEMIMICNSPENAVALQEANEDKDVIFTAFVCDEGQYEEVDWSPLKDKSVWLEVANHSGLTLAEAYIEAFGLYEYLRDTVKVESIHFLQRAIKYPSMEGVRCVDDLVRVTRANPPHVIDGSILELDEAEFLSMAEKAQAEISRKATAMNDLAFWKEEQRVEASPVEDGKPVGKITDKMIFRPFFIAGTTTLITGAPGVGKSCVKTAICACIAGSPREFLEGKSWTRCSPTDGHQYKVVDLIFDSDGGEAIEDHRRDFASDIGENNMNYIQKDMSGDPINYLKPENYSAFEKLLDDIEAHEGGPGQRIDVLMLDTLFALSHEANTLHPVNEFIKKLNHNHPYMAVGLLHHLNTKDKAFGGIRVLTGVRAHIKLFRTEDQIKAIPKDRLPLLSDPFTISIEKASNNKIAEDGESFAVRLEAGNVFALADKEDKETVHARRKAIVEGYAKQGLTQPEIARLFGVTDKTIRNWVNKTE